VLGPESWIAQAFSINPEQRIADFEDGVHEVSSVVFVLLTSGLAAEIRDATLLAAVRREFRPSRVDHNVHTKHRNDANADASL
jgi:hypothetical protein